MSSSEKQKKLLKLISENVGLEKPKTLYQMFLEAGYEESTAQQQSSERMGKGMATMITNELLTVAAIFLGPITALWIQRALDKRREARRKQQEVFRTIWATRTFPQRLQYRHVEALNTVGIDFSKESSVINAWEEYLDKLNSTEPKEEVHKPQFYKERDPKFFALIFAISKSVGYKFTLLEVEKQYYSPQAHGTWAEQDMILRNGVVSLFKNESALPIRLVTEEVIHNPPA